MRLFQNSGVYKAYLPRLRRLTSGLHTFSSQVGAFLDDRYGACHWLDPVLARDPAAFFTNADDPELQGAWATEKGLPPNSAHETILLAQIEEHRTEVFYNMDPMRYQTSFLRRLPGCVKTSIAWRAAPSPGVDLSGYDRVVCNFPSILESYTRAGWKSGFLAPAHDAVMDEYAHNRERPIDVLFVGGYSRHHRRRAEVLEAVASLAPRFEVRYCLDRSRLTRLAETGLGLLPLLAQHRRPKAIFKLSTDPVFGRDLYSLLSQTKVVLNGAVDMAGADRGNMRCFEAMGCGALMISDRGTYPEGMVDGVTMRLYDDAPSAPGVIEAMLENVELASAIAARGRDVVRERYSKARQWQSFVRLASES